MTTRPGIEERQQDSALLSAAARGGLDEIRRASGEPEPIQRRPLPPSEPRRDADVVLGYLDRIAAAVEDLLGQQRGPVGEGTVARAAQVAAPAAGATIVSVAAPGAGRYRLHVTVAKDAGAILPELQLRVGALPLSALPVGTALAGYDFDEVALDGGESIDVLHPAGAAGTFTAHISATRIE